MLLGVCMPSSWSITGVTLFLSPLSRLLFTHASTPDQTGLVPLQEATLPLR
jgi:hypothetical protein